MKKSGIAAAVVLMLAARVSATELPTADQVLEKVTAAYAAMKTFEADLRTTFEGSLAKSNWAGHAAMERSEKGGKTIEKASSVLKRTFADAGGNSDVMEIRGVNDGTFSWNEDRQSAGGEIRVTKDEAQGPHAFGLSEDLARNLTRAWKQYRYRVVGEDTIDGRKMHVLEGALDPATLSKSVKESSRKIWVGQDDFIVRRMVDSMRLVNRDKPEVTTKEWLNIKVNQPVDPALFVYTPPEGAKIVDRTQPKPAP